MKQRLTFEVGSMTDAVTDLLKQGESNAISSRVIEKHFSITARDVRKIVEHSRRSGVPILSSDSGYYFPADAEELRNYIAREQRRIRSQCVTLAPFKRLLRQIDSGMPDTPQMS